jgi:hypothetical protein
MTKYVYQLAIITRILMTVVVAFAGGAIAQTTGTKKADTVPAGDSANQTVDARQSGTWTVGVDPARNTVRLSNSTSEPLPVQVIGSGSARKAFQTRILVDPTNTGYATATMPIPAGKRLVIENISAIARTPEGLRMEINFFSYFDNNGDGIGDIADITFHRIALTDQGSFVGTAIASANHKVLVFADETIGTSHYGVVVQGRLNGAANGFAQGQVTFSGYLEDLPVVP